MITQASQENATGQEGQSAVAKRLNRSGLFSNVLASR